MKICVFYHGVFYLGNPPMLSGTALNIVAEQMDSMLLSGLEEAAAEIIIGVNGSDESSALCDLVLPGKAKITMHGIQSKSENRTLVMLQDWVKTHDDEWLVLYFHAKGASHGESAYGIDLARRWRNCMMRHCVFNWCQCVSDLYRYEAVGAHWQRGMDDTQHYFAGNFWFARASFLRTLPSLYARAAIKTHGIDTVASRHEAEGILGYGSRLPSIRDYADHPLTQCP